MPVLGAILGAQHGGYEFTAAGGLGSRAIAGPPMGQIRNAGLSRLQRQGLDSSSQASPPVLLRLRLLTAVSQAGLDSARSVSGRAAVTKRARTRELPERSRYTLLGPLLRQSWAKASVMPVLWGRTGAHGAAPWAELTPRGLLLTPGREKPRIQALRTYAVLPSPKPLGSSAVENLAEKTCPHSEPKIMSRKPLLAALLYAAAITTCFMHHQLASAAPGQSPDLAISCKITSRLLSYCLA
jgi:hypothetical protein